jgi:hypothetical protein
MSYAPRLEFLTARKRCGQYLGLAWQRYSTLLEGAHVTKVAPFHSVKENHHHDNNRCGPGSEIPPQNKVSGTGGKPLCKDCKKLDDDGK